MLGVNMNSIKMVELATQQWLEEWHQDFKGLCKVRECHP